MADETDEDHAKRVEAKETEWTWKELESCTKRKCDHRFSNLKWWDNMSEVGRKRPNCPMVARYCVECGGEL